MYYLRVTVYARVKCSGPSPASLQGSQCWNDPREVPLKRLLQKQKSLTAHCTNKSQDEGGDALC